jgi:putative transposase
MQRVVWRILLLFVSSIGSIWVGCLLILVLKRNSCLIECKGWAIGSKDFKKSLLSEEIERKNAAVEEAGDVNLEQERYDGKELREANELKWELFLERGLKMLGKDAAAIREDKKSAAWKVMLAAVIKKHTSATNVWITGKLTNAQK